MMIANNLQAEKCSTLNATVNSYNEWDPLEEVIVGSLDNAMFPPNHLSVNATIPQSLSKILMLFGSRRYPKFLIEEASKDLEHFIHILESEGVTVRRPDVMDFSVTYKTPDWKSKGLCTACPRDGLLVLGDEIIETPMAWRSRYFELHAYQTLLIEYFQKGARWTAAPKPKLTDRLYDRNYQIPQEGEPIRYVITECEPVFDAADFIRCGKDIFVTRSNVTNEMGIQWLERHVGDKFNIHRVESKCRQPMHIDSSFMPLAPGKLLVNPDYIDVAKIPDIFKSWDILIAPKPDIVTGGFFNANASMCSLWISMNVLMLDEKRVIIEKHQETMIRFLKDHGFEPIPCPFMNYAPFGGSFHCATLDIRRRGTLQSYF
jgi:glycine amidinotransferase